MSKGSSQCLQRKRNRPVCLYEGDCNNGWLCLLAKHLGPGLGLKGQLLLTQTMKCAIDEATYSIVNMTFGKKRIDKVDKDVLPFFIFKRRSNQIVIFIISRQWKKELPIYREKKCDEGSGTAHAAASGCSRCLGARGLVRDVYVVSGRRWSFCMCCLYCVLRVGSGEGTCSTCIHSCAREMCGAMPRNNMACTDSYMCACACAHSLPHKKVDLKLPLHSIALTNRIVPQGCCKMPRLMLQLFFFGWRSAVQAWENDMFVIRLQKRW